MLKKNMNNIKNNNLKWIINNKNNMKNKYNKYKKNNKIKLNYLINSK